jgi:hypothetical protein
MRSTFAKLVAAAVPVALFLGCSLTTDLSGFSGQEPPQVSSPESGSDASADGTIPTPEGGADATPADAATRFCIPGAHAFCDDFDVGAPLATWEGKAVDSKGTVSVSTQRAKSAPGALLTTMARRAASDPYALSAAFKKFPGARRIVVEFDMFLETPSFVDGDINAGIVSIYISSSTVGNAQIALSVGKGYTTFGNPGAPVNGDPLTGDTWLHARFDFDPSGKVTGSIGSVTWQQTFPAYVVGTNPETRLDLGVNGYNQPAPEFRVFYDNVTIDFP